ncbi:fimbrial protein [Citrobacter sp. CK206]|uniref:fimbrial protein n=1 Tax=Citrobacter sp. CK206 TaxID=2985115 RepID=UPI002577D1FA|nr:fimbrial protein [Citrobacter sp. CK206]MDM2957924.1 fimbrial protein [Citrobacter sp. CK206]
MLSKMGKYARLSLSAAGLCLMASATAQAATILRDCFTAPQYYSVTFSNEINANDNTANNIVKFDEHIVGNGVEMEANCTCPGNVFESTAIMELTLAGSPLNAGIAGYGYLTENIDIDVAGYSDAVNSLDGTGLIQISINQYPTPVSSMGKVIESMKPTEGSASVCSDSTHPGTPAPAKRTFRWNVIAATFYIKKPILGIEVIPPTILVQNYACLYFDSGSCDAGSAQHVSNIWLSGSLSAPLSCTINAGSTIEVDLGKIVSKQFVTRGQPPEGYALKNVDISYHCDGNAVGNTDRIKLTLSADQGVVDSSDPLIAKMLGRDDLGVRIFSEDNQNIALDGTFEFPVTMDEQGNGAVRIKAAPVSTTSATPAPGEFEGNVTVKMDLR